MNNDLKLDSNLNNVLAIYLRQLKNNNGYHGRYQFLLGTIRRHAFMDNQTVEEYMNERYTYKKYGKHIVLCFKNRLYE